MRNFIRLFLIFTAVFLMASCESTDAPAAVAPAPAETPAPAPVKEETPAKVESDNSEYSKAVSNISGNTVTFNQYEADLAAIHQIITELDEIMAQKDYQKWLTYVDQESLTYWKNPSHLAKATTRLPRKDMKVKNLFDYFHFIFIQARQGHQVESIRYIDSNSVKAVQQKDDDSEVVFYNFIKINGKWMVQLPTLE